MPQTLAFAPEPTLIATPGSLAAMAWDPDQYERFGSARERPARDLLASFDHPDPQFIVDLGCGTGRITMQLARRWPDGRVVGIDRSAAMLSRAGASGAGVEWAETDIEVWKPDSPIDVLFSNAALHWIDDHEKLFPLLARYLAPGGVLAVQMPANHHAPSHRIALELATGERWGPLLRDVMRPNPVRDGEEYVRMLDPLCRSVDTWTTTYLHVLTGPDAVTQWVRGSLLRPFLGRLDDLQTREFLEDYDRAVESAYVRLEGDRVLFPFTRRFVVATA